MRTLAWGALVLAAALRPAAEDAPVNPYAKAKVGDWIEWKVTSVQDGRKSECTQTDTVVERNEDSVVVETATRVKDQELKRNITIRLKEDPKTSKMIGQKQLGEGDENLEANGKVFKCHWILMEITVKGMENPIVTTQKIWTCAELPLGGKVKSELKSGGSTTTYVLSGFGFGKK